MRNANTIFRNRLFVFALLIFGLGSLPVAAQITLVGFVKTVAPEAVLLIDGQPIKAQPGMPLQRGFRIRTGPQGGLGVTLRDNTQLAFGPNTEFAMDDYQFSPTKDELSLRGSILRGTLQYISGLIAKLKPDGVAISTPTGVVGLRGTHVLIQIDEENP